METTPGIMRRVTQALMEAGDGSPLGPVGVLSKMGSLHGEEGLAQDEELAHRIHIRNGEDDAPTIQDDGMLLIKLGAMPEAR